jgi:hypothetical protein
VIAIVVALFNAVAAFVIIALVAVYYVVERTPGFRPRDSPVGLPADTGPRRLLKAKQVLQIIVAIKQVFAVDWFNVRQSVDSGHVNGTSGGSARTGTGGSPCPTRR